MFNLKMESNVGSVSVVTSKNRGLNAEEWADIAVNRIVQISADTPLPLREQAIAYKGRIKSLLIGYFQQVAKSERSTIKRVLEQQGHLDIAKNIEDI
jgi:hypothetical protein